MRTVTAEFIHGAIDGMIDKRFRNEDGDIVHITHVVDPVDRNGVHQGKIFHIEDEIGAMLDAIGVDNEVEALLCFESPATDIYAICVTFMAEGTFHTHNFATEA